MNRTILSIILLTCSTIPVAAQQSNQDDHAAIKESITRFFDGIAAIDLNAMKEWVTPDFLLLEDGQIWNLDTLAAQEPQMKQMDIKRINKLDFIRIETKGNMGWVAYHNRADIEIQGQSIILRWIESAVLIRDKNRWKIQLLHSTTIKSVPEGDDHP